MDPSTLGVILTGSSLYVSLLPKLEDVRRAGPDSETASDVHSGVVMASLALIGSGVLIAYLGGDKRVITMTVGMSLLMAAIYEITLRMRGEGSPPPPAYGYRG